MVQIHKHKELMKLYPFNDSGIESTNILGKKWTQKIHDPTPQPRVNNIAGNFGQRLQDKPSFMHSRMWKSHYLVSDDEVFVQQ